MHRKILAILAAMSLCVCTVALSNPLVYHLNLVDGEYSVTGTISTDGKIGLLLAEDITAWNLTITGLGENLSSTTGDGIQCGPSCGIEATPDALTEVGGSLQFLFPGDPYAYTLTFSLDGADANPVGCSGCAGGVIIRDLIVVGTVAPAFVGALSRKIHGGAGTFDLPLSAAPTNPTTEPRLGPSQTIVFSFDKPVTGATATVSEGAATAAAPTFSGNEVIVSLADVTDQQYVTIALTNVASSDGGTGGSGSVRLGFLLGDVNQNRVVTVADLGMVNQQLAQSVTAANYLKDVNASGTLSVADKAITNANLTKALPAP